LIYKFVTEREQRIEVTVQRLLIDGYNLLHASEVFVTSGEAATLERTRMAFLQFLAASLPERQRRCTTIVFDAAQAPIGLPRQLLFAGMNVHFSKRPQHADDLLEDMLSKAKGTRELLVISSDHRVQRAARQSGANYIDSEQWLSDLKRDQQAMSQVAGYNDAKPETSSWESSPELQQWLQAFAQPKPEPMVKPPVVTNIASQTPTPSEAMQVKKKEEPQWNPFPPGYAEDLLSEE
jgi:uncharacterized protein